MSNTRRETILKRLHTLNRSNFDSIANDIFIYQSEYNSVYSNYLFDIGFTPGKENDIDSIPHLPISAFKHHDVVTGEWPISTVFTSSGTMGTQHSRHLVRSTSQYLENCEKGFNTFYGDFSEYCFLALLPSYLEREGSSLIYMMEYFIKKSVYRESGFYLSDYTALIDQLHINQKKKIKTVLFGVSFALLDLAEMVEMQFPDLIIMETGGMKGRRNEIPRNVLHDVLKKAFGVPHIHSEYGMTELFSQAYSKGAGIFTPTATMHVNTCQISDPFTTERKGKTGVLRITDLANVDTCSFIATEDLAIIHEDDTFSIMGRLDHSDLRGCNLLLEEVK